MTRLGPGLVVSVMCLALAACGGMLVGDAGPTATPAATEEATRKPPRTPRATRDPAATATPTPRPPAATPFPDDIPGLSGLLGADGRLTVLILGSDARDGLAGERTDAIIVATINPRDGKVAMVSLPRDTINVPIADGVTYQGRINGLLAEFERTSGKRNSALRRTKSALAYAFGTEIDYYVLVGFRGLERLVDSVGGIQVTLKEPLIDPGMHVSKKGLRLKAGTRRLDGRYTLAFTRTRKTDSDYERSRRQHQVLAAAGKRVLARGAAALPALVELARDRLETDIPFEAAPALLALAARANLNRPKSVVLAPLTFAQPGPIAYTIVLRIDAVRRMFDRVFGPVN